MQKTPPQRRLFIMCFSCLKIDFLHGTINSVMVYQGQVLKIHSDFYYVNSDEKIHECKLREVLKKQKQRVVVGDFVEFEDEKITKILPRKNFIPLIIFLLENLRMSLNLCI